MHRATLMSLLLVGCSGDDSTDTTPATTGDTGTTDTVTTPPYEATWDGVQQLFGDHCDHCHPEQQGLDLHVDLPLDAAGYQFFVVPGDPDNSRLWLAVTGGTVSPMPYDVGLLPIETVQPIYDWIAAGASFE